eukprot:TRINITY_DN7437_c0_g1_i1.p1 TRINITY_DN7437_c0_g1~~TRINITY_DN7437_c0_g1_i1.p1  ORF type:complete len:282 (-),score=81.17 TRINITY_DN7437_c0_g1_i1:93-938(-)
MKPLSTMVRHFLSQFVRMTTSLEYLRDTFKFAYSGARVLSIAEYNAKGSDEGKRDAPTELAVILDATIFHPQGGGQPSDVGEITSTGESAARFQVNKVEKRDDGCVLHVGSFVSEECKFAEGDIVDLQVDSESRVLNARCHSAGHLLDLALEDIGVQLESVKGYHFPKSGSYVEYSGNIPADQRDKVVSQLQEKLDELIAKDIPVEVITAQDKSEVLSHCRESDLPKNYESLSSVRVVKFEGRFGCPCGGTHVQRSSQIGKISGLKIQKKGANIRIKYAVV